MYSCSNEIDVNATPKETMVVYGILEPDQDTHYIKVNKTYLLQGDAIAAAKDPTNTQYPDILDVKVNAMNGNTVAQTATFTRVMGTSREAGLFPAPEQPLYRYIGNFATDNLQLNIKNIQTGTTVTSSTSLLGNLVVDRPAPLPLVEVVNWTSTYGYKVKFYSAKAGKMYQVSIRFNYKELVGNNTTDTAYKYIDWNLGSLLSTTTNGNEPMEVLIEGNRFYQFCQSSMEVNPNLKRFAGKLDFSIVAANEALATYVETNAPSNTIVQERPSFTNIENGIGIFASRRIYHRTNVGMSNASIQELKTGALTSNLNFQ